MDITSERLHLRDLAEKDWQALHSLRTHPDVYRYNHFGPESEEETRSWIRETMVHNRLTPRLSHNCSIVLKATDEVIGWIGFGLPSPGKAAYSDLSFGYALLPAFWNQGYMTEALRAMIDFAFTTTDANSISDTCDVRNLGSARVMEKAGLRQVERFADVDEKVGEPTESYRYRILRSEWEANTRHFTGEIGPATPADIAEMAAIFPDWGARHKHEERWQQQEQGKAVYLIARQQGHPVAHAYLKWQGAGDPHVVERRTIPCPDIEDLFVLGDWRSQGVGTALIHAAEEQVLAQGFQHIGLSVGIENPAARRLYERLGYQDAGFGEYTEHGTYLDAQGQSRVWEERCVYLMKELT
ncbi:MAG: GNAT family N-acetyltransferase [Caldilineaceae bacterium]